MARRYLGRVSDEMSERLLRISESHFWETYGGPWRFNQVVGWVRLFVLGTQIRGDLWMANAKRLTRAGQRRFRFSGKAFEMSCYEDMASEQIRAEVEERLRSCVRDPRSGRLHIDLECFRVASQFLDWRSLCDAGRTRWRSDGETNA